MFKFFSNFSGSDQHSDFLSCSNYQMLSSYRACCKRSCSVKALAIMSRSEKGLRPAFMKAKHTSLLTVLLLLTSSVDVCDGLKNFSRPQCYVPSVAVLSPSSVINIVFGHRMSTSTSNEVGHPGRRDNENKMTDNIKTWSSDFLFGLTHPPQSLSRT
jgi:hypothetical protein